MIITKNFSYLQDVINHDKSVGGKFTKALVWEASTGAEKFGSKMINQLQTKLQNLIYQVILNTTTSKVQTQKL